MNITLPAEVLDEDEWNSYLINAVPVLEKLWQAGKYEQFETYKAVSGYTYAEYREYIASHSIYAQHIPIIRRTITESIASIVVDVQPMSSPAGGIFSINC